MTFSLYQKLTTRLDLGASAPPWLKIARHLQSGSPFVLLLGFAILFFPIRAWSETKLKSSPKVSAYSEPEGFLGGGGLFLIPSYLKMTSYSGQYGLIIGGGGYLHLFKNQFRIGGFGATINFGPTNQWANRVGFGGTITGYNQQITPWFALSYTLMLGFGNSDLKIYLGSDPAGYKAGAKVIEEYNNFLFLLTPVIGFEFTVLKWLKIAILGNFVYAYSWPESFLGGGGGIYLLVGRFRK